MAMPIASSSNRSHNIFDSIIAALMIVAALLFMVFIHQRTGTGSFSTYEFSVRLPTAAGLTMGSDVRVGGMKVGSISGMDLEPKSYQALVRLRLRSDLRLPEDSLMAAVTPAMGGGYLSIAPGRSATSIKPDQLVVPPRADRQLLSRAAPSN